jgi:hypothetical protein
LRIRCLSRATSVDIPSSAGIIGIISSTTSVIRLCNSELLLRTMSPFCTVHPDRPEGTGARSRHGTGPG